MELGLLLKMRLHLIYITVRMMIYYFECNENVIQRNMTLASSPDGIQIPFAKAIWKTASWPSESKYLYYIH